MAAFEVLEKSRQARSYGYREEVGFVGWGGEEVQDSGEEEAGCFFFRGEAEKLSVEWKKFLFAGEGRGH